MESTAIDILVWASLALLGLATYFLRGIHADIKKMREELNKQNVSQAVMQQQINTHEQRITRLEERS